MTTEEGGCCRCCFSFIFTSGLTALFIWLSLRASNPTCSIENFDVFSLNKTANATFIRINHTISYDLKLNNKGNKDKGIYYDTLNITFYYKPNQTLIPIGNDTFHAFYQGYGKNTHRKDNITAPGVRWENATATTAAFRVELNTSIRFKIVFWKTKRHRLDLSAELLVDEQGSLIKKKKKKGVKLTSEARISKSCNNMFQLLGVFGVLFSILL